MREEPVNNTELREKIIRGLDIAIQKLIRAKQQEDGYLVVERNGEVIKIRARDLPAA